MRKLVVVLVVLMLLLLARPGRAYDLGEPQTRKQVEGGYTLQTWLVGRKPYRRQVVAIVQPNNKFDMVIVRFEEAEGALPAVAELWLKDMLPRLAERPKLAVVDNDGRVRLFALGSAEVLAQLRAIHVLPAADGDEDEDSPDAEPTSAPARSDEMAHRASGDQVARR